jgi:hypothetical protein
LNEFVVLLPAITTTQINCVKIAIVTAEYLFNDIRLAAKVLCGESETVK